MLFSRAVWPGAISALILGTSARQNLFSITVSPGLEGPTSGRNECPEVGNLHDTDPELGPFTPFTHFSLLSSRTFTSLAHPAFLGYGVRIKKAKGFCDDSVNAYTGHIDIRARHLFFYFFESRRDPDTDDVIFWTNGGPGCSSSMGLFMELGPCRMNSTSRTSTTPHPESWISTANVFFVDQPVGVGYSYADFEESVATTEEAAKDIASFIAIFFEHFTKFKGRALHMARESYGGRYVPVFAAEVYDQNTRLVKAGMEPINLTSIMVGNGITDFYAMFSSLYDISCFGSSLPSIYDIATCVRMKQALPRCQGWMKEGCVNQFDNINCKAAVEFCSSGLLEPFFNTHMNPYDISKQCEGKLEDTFCYPLTKNISAYLSYPSTHQLLGVDSSLSNTTFNMCTPSLDVAFYASLDKYRPTYLYVAALLERGIRTLIYVGAYDWICNWLGNEAWTLQLEWSGQDVFRATGMREWKVDGTRVGMVRSASGLTFTTMDGAGHLVPYDKPKESLEMVKRWLAGKGLEL